VSRSGRRADDAFLRGLQRLVGTRPSDTHHTGTPPSPAPADRRSGASATGSRGRLPGRLRRLDDAGARGRLGGPLALLRDLPQLGLLVVALIVVAGGARVATRHRAESRQAAATQRDTLVPPTTTAVPTAPAPVAPVLGPDAGTDVASYLAARSAAAQALGRTLPGEQLLAVVSFTTFQRPSGVGAVVGGLAVDAALVHVPVSVRGAPRPTASGVVRGVPGLDEEALRSVLARQATALDVDAADDQRQGETTQPVNADIQAQVQDFLDEAAGAREQAAALRDDGACVYAVMVGGSAAELAAVALRPGVRLVDPATGPGLAPADAQPRGLLPTDTAPTTFATGPLAAA